MRGGPTEMDLVFCLPSATPTTAARSFRRRKLHPSVRPTDASERVSVRAGDQASNSFRPQIWCSFFTNDSLLPRSPTRPLSRLSVSQELSSGGARGTLTQGRRRTDPKTTEFAAAASVSVSQSVSHPGHSSEVGKSESWRERRKEGRTIEERRPK